MYMCRGQHHLRVISPLYPCGSWTSNSGDRTLQLHLLSHLNAFQNMYYIPVCVCGSEELHGRLVVGTLLPEPPC